MANFWQQLVNWVKAKLAWAAEAAWNFASAAAENIKTNSDKWTLAKKMMDKNYPSSTVTSKSWMWNKRFWETKDSIANWNMVQARTKLQGLKKQFDENNS